MVSQTTENYLKAIYGLAGERGEVNTSDIGHALGVSLPTVNSMVKKLSEMGFLDYQKYRPLVLTDKGKREAARVVRKHRLTEMYLVEKMGFGWEEVHEIAEQIEHIVSPAFFDRMDELMGFPQYDPHGSPIPDVKGKFPQRRVRKLSECGSDARVVLRGLKDSSEEFLRYLNGKELSLGVELHVTGFEEYDGSMEVSYKGHPREVFSREVCDQLLVE